MTNELTISKIRVHGLFRISAFKQLLLSLLLLYFLNFLLEWNYFSFVSPSYSQYNFPLNFNFIKYIEVKVMLLILSIGIWQLFYQNKFLFSIFILLIFFFFIPASILFSYSNFSRAPIYSIFFMLFTILCISKLKIKIIYIQMPELYKILGLFTLILIFIIPFIYKFGFYINIENIFLKDVNETRKIFSLNCTGLFDYFFNWLSNVILPVSFI